MNHRHQSVRPSAIVFTVVLIITAIAVNADWLWIVLALWLLSGLYALYMALTGRV